MQKFSVYGSLVVRKYEPDDRASVYLASDVDARITELKRELDGANNAIALFLGPDGERHIGRFADAVAQIAEPVNKSLMER